MPINYVKKKQHVYWGSNMSPREEFRINGCLRVETQEWVVDYFDDVGKSAEQIEDYTIDAFGSIIDELDYPSEDVLSPIKDLAYTLLKAVKGNNKTLAQELVDAVEWLEQELQQDGEHVNEHIGKLKTGIKEWEKIKGTLNLE